MIYFLQFVMFSNDDCRDKLWIQRRAEHTLNSMTLCVRLEFMIEQKVFMPRGWNDCSGMGMGRNRKSPVGIPWEWELVTKLRMKMGKNGN